MRGACGKRVSPLHEHVLPAPTGWPCALARCPKAPGQAWATTVRDRFAEFFAAVSQLRRFRGRQRRSVKA